MTIAFINPFDLLGLDASSITGMLKEWGVETTEEVVRHLLNIGTPIVIVACIFTSMIWNFWRRKRRIQKWREEKIEETLGREFGLYLDKKRNWLYRMWNLTRPKKAKHIYIETKFQSKPPHDKEDPKENVHSEPRESLMKFYLENVLVRDNKAQFLYCILAGSGMGKTTFAVNLVKRYYGMYTQETMPYDIYLLSLSNEAVIENIERIQSQGRSILILDALDENNDAVKDYADFKEKLEKAIARFRIVIITCRTQFFADDENEPKQSKLAFYGKNRTLQEYYRHYISVFDSKDIDNYLKRKYRNKKKRKQAKRIVEKCGQLMVRPLLLSYIDDLLAYPNVKIVFSYNIYEILIDKWLEREVDFWKLHKGTVPKGLKERLLNFSETLAVDIYNKREERGGLFITSEEVDQFMKENGFTESYSYKGRSLVNRDSVGKIKFAHKSFLEYFLAQQMFKGEIVVPFEGMDMVKEFYQQQCLAEYVLLRKQGKVWDTLYMMKERVLVVNDATDFRHEHLNMVYRWDCLFVAWNAATESLWNWVKYQPSIKKIVVYNYDGSNTLNKILQLHKLDSLMIIGDTELGKGFQKKARSKTETLDFKRTKGKVYLTIDDVNNVMRHMEMSKLMCQNVDVINYINLKYYRKTKGIV